MSLAIEGAAENLPEVVVDWPVAVGGCVGFEEAFHSDNETRSVSIEWEGEFGSVHLGTGISDVIIG